MVQRNETFLACIDFSPCFQSHNEFRPTHIACQKANRWIECANKETFTLPQSCSRIIFALPFSRPSVVTEVSFTIEENWLWTKQRVLYSKRVSKSARVNLTSCQFLLICDTKRSFFNYMFGVRSRNRKRRMEDRKIYHETNDSAGKFGGCMVRGSIIYQDLMDNTCPSALVLQLAVFYTGARLYIG